MFRTSGQHDLARSPAAEATEEHLSDTLHHTKCRFGGFGGLAVCRVDETKNGRDADATVLRSLDAHHIPSRPQQREVGQDAGRARQELGDLLQCLGGFQMPSPFGHEAIAMPWTWAPAISMSNSNQLQYTDTLVIVLRDVLISCCTVTVPGRCS